MTDYAREATYEQLMKILRLKLFEKEVFLVLQQKSPENYMYLYYLHVHVHCTHWYKPGAHKRRSDQLGILTCIMMYVILVTPLL